MRLWERSTSGSARRAHKLVEDYLGARRMPAPIQAAIERAVAEKLAWGTLPALDAAMSAAVDLYAEPPELASAETGTVYWQGLAWPQATPSN